MNHPWMKSECAIPDLLPISTMNEPPSDSYIDSFVPEHLGGTLKPKFSGKDLDKRRKVFKQNFMES